MGITKQSLDLLLAENAFKPVTGSYLSLGKQNLSVSREDINALFIKYGLDTAKLNSLYEKGIFDKSTKYGSGNIHDHDLLSCFSQARYRSLDRSDYEGADVVHDMNEPLPDSLKGQFDFIFNGSVMDNVFDPATLIKNTTQLLKPGGRILHLEHAGSYPGAFVMFSPEWLYSYYAVNNFKDCKTYVFLGNERGEGRFNWFGPMFSWKPAFTQAENYDYESAIKSASGMMHVLVIAEKGEESTHDKNPIQMQYLDDSVPDWRKRHDDFLKSPRPLIPLEKPGGKIVLPFLSDHYEYLGSYQAG